MKKKPRLAVYGGLLLLGLWSSGCSDIKQPTPANLEPGLSVHSEGWLDPDAAAFHGIFIRQGIAWDLSNCQQCHGVDYAGGVAESTCLPCHPGTPEDCAVCHGGTENHSGAPPEDLDGNTAVSVPTVGTHTVHVEGDDGSDGVPCASCHEVPENYFAVGHIDSDLPAEVVFFGLAVVNGATPNYVAATPGCDNTYCHGNWGLSRAESRFPNVYSDEVMIGNNASPVWTDPATGQCGSCHDLPPRGHVDYALSQCFICHSTVDVDGNISDKRKHINGQINVFNQEYPIF